MLDRYGWPDMENSWTWPVSKEAPMQVEVYSAVEGVELLLNGKNHPFQVLVGRNPVLNLQFLKDKGQSCNKGIARTTQEP